MVLSSLWLRLLGWISPGRFFFDLKNGFLWLGWVFLLTGCSSFMDFRYHDGVLKKKPKDFEALLDAPEERVSKNPPSFGPLKREALPPLLLQKVSLSLAGQISLKEAFLELARQCKINILVAPECRAVQHLCYHAHQQPLMEVVQNLCQMGNLRYVFMHNALHIMADQPFLKTHNIQFLLGSRKTQTETSVKTDVFADGFSKNGKTGSGDNGSTILMNTAHTVDFWDELEKNLTMMLAKRSKKNTKEAPSYTLNKYAGMLSVYGTQKQQDMVSQYLSQLQKLITAQILIEAKIIEIDLTQEYRGGVNWQAFLKTGTPQMSPSLNQGKEGLKGDLDGLKSDSAGQYSFSFSSKNLNAFARFMEKFGTVRTLANPRQTVINNQAAILKVAHNEVFFELQIQDEIWNPGQNPSGNLRQRAQSRIQTVPIGLILYVHPSLNCETGEIIVSLHPTISRIVDRKSDPAAAFYGAPGHPAIDSQIPVVQVREMDSVIVARPGQVIVTGGLMEERNESTRVGLPFLSGVPILGQAFSQQEKQSKVVELVILLKLTVLDQNYTLDLADQRLTKEFVRDPRPFKAP